MSLLPYQHRVVQERTDLDLKTRALAAWIGGDGYDRIEKEEQERLIKQHEIMVAYIDILDARIAGFYKRK